MELLGPDMFLLDEYDIANVTQVILCLVLALYLLSLKRKSLSTWLIAGILMSLAGYYFLSALEFKQLINFLIDDIFWSAQFILLLCMGTALVQSVYHFPYPSPSQRAEARVALAACVLALLIVIGASVYSLILFLDHSVFSGLRILLTMNFIVIEGFWSIVVLLRRTVMFSEEKAPLWRKLVAPQTPAAKATSALAAVFMIPIAISGLALLQQTVAPALPFEPIVSAGLLVFAFSLTLVYLNYSDITFTFLTKLVGATLLTLLAVLGIVGYIIGESYGRSYRNENLIADHQTIHFEPNQTEGYDISVIPFHFDDELGERLTMDDNENVPLPLNFSFPFYTTDVYREVYVTDNGVVLFNSEKSFGGFFINGREAGIAPLFMALQPATEGGGVYYKGDQATFTVTWYQLSTDIGDDSYTMQLTLYANGAFDITYNGLQPRLTYYSINYDYAPGGLGIMPGKTGTGTESIRFAQDLPYTSIGKQGVFENYRLDYAQYIHPNMLPLLYVVLAASVFILVGFPLFFHFSLIKPIHNLQKGIRQIEAGNLSVSVPVQFNDEIGYLTGGFNQMAGQLHDLVNNLEQKVIARTSRLETVAHLSGQLNAILDFDQILSEMVNQIQQRFDHHAHIYLLDEAGQNLVLSGRAGKSGTRLKGTKHHLPLDAPTNPVVQAAQEHRIISVDDVRQDPNRLAHSLLSDTRSEMAVPIIQEEQVVGVLDVQSDQVGGLDEGDADLLQSLANHLAIALTNAQLFEQITQANSEIRVLNEQLKEENLRMSAELDVTRRLQQMILPKAEELQAIEGLDIAGYMNPADEVGGDYYDILRQPDGLLAAIGDVTGHGLESGVVMLMTQTAIRTLLEHGETDPVKFVETLNKTLYHNVQRMKVNRMLTFALLQYADKALKLVGYHEQLIVVRQSGQIELVDTVKLGTFLGLEPDVRHLLVESAVQLEPGDGVVLYTDGITEAESEGQEFYGLQRLCDVISRNWPQPAEAIKQAVVEDVYGFIGGQKMYDDVTLVVIKQEC
jgi:serine phosphatase RsbU (regulator of sigma subunit)/HAMP domain-containing protein